MSDGMGRELAYLSSHATNRYFIPNWGIYCVFGNNFMNEGSRLYSRVYEEDSITLNLFGIFLSK